jgi:hypothetical protein
MTQSVKSGFLRDDTTGALVVSGGGSSTPVNYSLVDGWTFNFRAADTTGREITCSPTGTPSSLFAADRGHAFPVYFSRSLTVQLGVAITTAVAATNLEMVFCTDDVVNNRPLNATSLGLIDSSTAGNKYAATSQAVVAGTRYWILVVSRGGTPTIRTATSPPYVLNTAALDTTGVYAWRYTGLAATVPSTLPAPIAADGTVPLVIAKIV